MLIIHMWNISELAEISNYKYIVKVNNKIIADGLIEGHKRSEGWQALIKQLGEER